MSLTALHVRDIGTQAPREIWIALDRKARKPRFADLPVRVVRFSGQMLNYAVDTLEVQDVRVRITSPARTVVDCFRYRRKVGLDVALEAVRDAVGARRATVDEILSAAEVCRIRTATRPTWSRPSHDNSYVRNRPGTVQLKPRRALRVTSEHGFHQAAKRVGD